MDDARRSFRRISAGVVLIALLASTATAQDEKGAVSTLVRNLAQRYLGKPPDHLGPETKTQIAGRWYLRWDVKEAARDPDMHTFCDFHVDGTAKCAFGLAGRCRYQVQSDHILVLCPGKKRDLGGKGWVFLVDGKLYTPSHEDGITELVRLPDKAK